MESFFFQRLSFANSKSLFFSRSEERGERGKKRQEKVIKSSRNALVQNILLSFLPFPRPFFFRSNFFLFPSWCRRRRGGKVAVSNSAWIVATRGKGDSHSSPPPSLSASGGGSLNSSDFFVAFLQVLWQADELFNFSIV